MAGNGLPSAERMNEFGGPMVCIDGVGVAGMRGGVRAAGETGTVRGNDGEGPEGPSPCYLAEMVTSVGWRVQVAC